MADTNTYTSKQKIEKWTTRAKFKALDLSDIPVGTEYNLTGAIEKEDLDASIQTTIDSVAGKLDKTGGTITGSLTISQNLIVNGTTSTVESTSLKIKDKLIYVAKDNTAALTTPAGIITPKYDGTNNGGIVYDNTGTAYVGDISLDSNGNVDVTNSDLQAIATRDEVGTFTDGHIIKWSNNKLVDGGDLSSNITGTDGVTVTKGSDGNVEISGSGCVRSQAKTVGINDRLVYGIYKNADVKYFVTTDPHTGANSQLPAYSSDGTYVATIKSGSPRVDLDCANKKYVDDNITAIKSFSVTVYAAGD